MKKTFSIFYSLAILSLIFSANAGIVKAQVQNNTYTPLAPVPGLTTPTTCDPSKSTADQVTDPNCKTDVTTFIPALVRFAIIIAGGLAVVMIVIGGVQYATSDAIGGKSEGKQKIENAIWGLVLAIAAFVVLQTVNPNTLKLNLDLTINSSTAGAPSTTASTTSSGAGGSLAWPSAWAGGVSVLDADARAKLGALKPPVTVWHSDCTIIGAPGCTSLDGISTAALSGLAELSNHSIGSGATILITGGTEYWLHCVPTSIADANGICTNLSANKTMHTPGGGAVDLQSDPTLNSVIKNFGTPAAATGNGCESSSLGVYTLDNGTYVKEDAGHWHVCYN